MANNRRSRRNKRKKSSESGCDGQSSKQFKHGGHDGQCTAEPDLTTNVSASVSDIICAANNVLFDQNTIGDTLDVTGTSDSQSVFSSPTRTVSPNTIEQRESRSNKMAASTCSDSEKLDKLIDAVSDVKKNQDKMRSMFESKLDKLKNELMENIDSKVNNLRQDISLELGREASRIDTILTTIQSMQTRLDTVEQAQTNQHEARMETDNGQATQEPQIEGEGRPRFRPRNDDSDFSIIASGVPTLEDEGSLLQKMKDIIHSLGNAVSENVNVTSVTRFRSNYENRPGLVKVTLRSRQEKILILRNKMALKNSHAYKRVYLKSCKSHAERLIEQNARAILRHLPDGQKYRVDANGRIQQRNQNRNQQNRSSD